MKKLTTVLTALFILGVLWGKTPGRKEFSAAFVAVAQKGNPTVVSIVSEKTVTKQFPHYFMNPWGEDQKDMDFKGESLGSGVIIDSKHGYIVTNNHVVEDADDIQVILFDKREISAEILATDPLSDIALIKVDADDLIQAKYGDSDDLDIGEWVVAIGSPFGLNLNHTVTAGIVSAKGRSDVISRGNFENFIQHDAAINPGNSGGGLFNLDGELVGINTAIATDGFSRASAGVGFAVPVNQVKRVVTDLIENGHVTRGWLGVSIQDIDKNMAKALDLKDSNGAIIAQVIPDSPAASSDIKEQDIITAVDGIKVEDASGLNNIVASRRPGDKVKFERLRDHKPKSVYVKLGTRPDEDDLASSFLGTSDFDILGLKVEKLDLSASRANYNTDHGVIIKDVKSGSVAARADIRKGEVIVKLGKEEIDSVDEYLNILDNYEKGDPILLLVKRDGGSRFVALEIE